jgi:hypothetical protein
MLLISTLTVVRSSYRKYQSIIDRKKSSSAEFDSFVGDLQRKHLNCINHVVVFSVDFVNEFSGFVGLKVKISINY